MAWQGSSGVGRVLARHGMARRGKAWGSTPIGEMTSTRWDHRKTSRARELRSWRSRAGGLVSVGDVEWLIR